MKSKIILIFVLLPLIAFAENYRETRNLELPADGLHVLSVRCGAGELTLKGIEGTGSIHVIAEIESEGTDKEEIRLLADKLIQLDLRREYNQALLSGNVVIPPLTNIDARIHLRIQLPVNMNVRIVDGSGSMDITNIIGNLSIADDSGAITAENITGRVQIEDGSGDIEIQDVQGSLEIIDGSGRIVIQRVTGDVTINDASGGIEVNDIGGSVTVSDGSGSIDIYRVKKNVFIREPGSGELEVDGVQGKVTIRE
ncbi:hypothetical protein D1BOALGB6SA_199 [Olavius sp. associated proteobacterium Delta 1]|nr:hypothetical protein D1BOALGB6SA_199 [Olavius sp. associated proteobacterium Delta 1]